MGELRESSVASRSLRSTNNPWTHGHAPEITTVAQPDGDEASVIVVYHPDETPEEEQNGDMDEETEERYSPITILLTRSSVTILLLNTYATGNDCRVLRKRVSFFLHQGVGRYYLFR